VPGVLTLHFDITSPAAAVAVLRLQALVDAGATVRFSPIDTLGLDIDVPPTRELLDELVRYADRAAELGLAMRRPSRQPPTLRAHVVGEVAEAADLGASWRWRCLRAYWSEDRDLHDEDTLVELALAAGLEEAPVRRALGDRLTVHGLRDRMTHQRRRGIGGVPVLEFDGTFVSAELPDADLRRLAGL
jgi:2-hydroxychromene-2-carboxylate isomerase